MTDEKEIGQGAAGRVGRQAGRTMEGRKRGGKKGGGEEKGDAQVMNILFRQN